MAASFKAIISTHSIRTSKQIPSFEIRHLNFANISIFYTGEFRSFLSRLESFTLSIKPFETGGGWAFNTSYFFPGFADFLSRHLGTLRSITLQECYAIEPSDRNHPNAYAWRHFFPPLTGALAEVRKEEPSVGPTKFNVIYNNTPAKMLRLEDPPRYMDANLISRAKAKLAMEHQGPSMFYGNVDQKYGGLFHEKTTSLEEFLYGDDEREYRRFMAVVQRRTVVRG
jgi:hypothetical protein